MQHLRPGSVLFFRESLATSLQRVGLDGLRQLVLVVTEVQVHSNVEAVGTNLKAPPLSQGAELRLHGWPFVPWMA